MTAYIEFSQGVKESAVPQIRVTRAKDGSSGTATFYFEKPDIFDKDSTADITGMYLVDDEGEIITREVKGKFVNGKANAIEAILIMRSEQEWNRFLRFMERYAEEQGLELTKS